MIHLLLILEGLFQLSWSENATCSGAANDNATLQKAGFKTKNGQLVFASSVNTGETVDARQRAE